LYLILEEDMVRSSAAITMPHHAAAPRAGWAPLVVVASAHLMAILDATIMFVALPDAQRALGLTATSRSWVIAAYTLAFAATLLPGGRLADRLGARRTLVIGAIGFAAASAVAGAATSGATLIAARAVQGAFAAPLVSSTKALLLAVYVDDDERTKAIGRFTATLTAGAAAGLILGGALTGALGWRWCLYVNAPLALVAAAGAARFLPAPPVRPGTRIDVASVMLAAAGMTALVYGLGEAPALGWRSAAVVGSLLAAVALLAGFAARQAGARHPLLPLAVVRDRNRGGALLATVVNSLSTFGLMLILTYQLQTVMRYSPLRTGFALIPFAVAATLGSAVIAPWLQRRLAPRWPIVGGLALSAAGLLPLVGLAAAGQALPLIVTATIVEGFGTGIGSPAMLQTALHGVPPAAAGAASAASSAAGQLGSSIGAALLSTIAAAATASYLAAHPAAGGAAGIVHGFAVAMLWGAGILVAVAVPAAVLIDAPSPRRPVKPPCAA
jgi:EmrB/QacA subfamily drug resistance transporter